MARTLLDLVFPPGTLEVALLPLVSEEGGRRRLVAVEGVLRGVKPSDLGGADLLLDYAGKSKDRSPVDRASVATVLRTGGLLDALLDLVVNTSARSLARDPEFVEVLLAAADEAGVANDRLVLELNECGRYLADDGFRRGLDALRAGGVRVALADAGLPELEASLLADARPSFVKLAPRHLAVPGRVRALLDRLRAADTTVVAAGLEDEGALQAARAAGVSLLQGAHIAAPMTIDELARHALYLDAQREDDRATA